MIKYFDMILCCELLIDSRFFEFVFFSCEELWGAHLIVLVADKNKQVAELVI